MHSFATTLVAAQIFTTGVNAGAVFEKLHEVIHSAERIIDEAQPLFNEIEGDLHDIGKVVHKKAETYLSLFEDFKQNILEEDVVDELLRGNFVTSSISKSELGCTIEESVYDNMFTETIVTAPALPYGLDYTQ